MSDSDYRIEYRSISRVAFPSALGMRTYLEGEA